MNDKGPVENIPDEAFLERLQSELEVWQRQRVVGRRQVASILAYYGVRHDVFERAWRLTRTAAIFAALGAILIGVGIILLVASNQSAGTDLPRLVKIAGLLAGMLAGYALGYFLRYETRFKAVGEAVILLSAIAYGAVVFLAAQVYNVTANDPTLLLYWFLGVLPLAYVVRSGHLAALSLVTLGAWLGWRATSSMEDSHPDQEEIIFIRTTALFLMLGLLSYFLAPLHRAFKPTAEMARTFQMMGLMTIFVTLFLLSFRVSESFTVPDAPDGLVVAYGVVACLTAVSILASIWLSATPSPTLFLEAGACVGLVGAAFFAVFLPFDDPDIYAVTFNVLTLATIVGAVPVGLARRQEGYINAAIAAFAVLVIARYVDLAWGLQERSLFFIGAGVLFLAGASALEYYRRRVLRPLREV